MVQVRKNRTIEVGFQTLPEGRIDPFTRENWQRDINAATMITGDPETCWRFKLVAHYYISDLNDYLFRGRRSRNQVRLLRWSETSDPLESSGGKTGWTPLFRTPLEIAVRRSLGQRTIDQGTHNRP